MDSIVESLQILKHKISKNNAYLGIASGFAVYAFSLFLSWANAPQGMILRDGSDSSGWEGRAYLALIPLGVSLYRVFLSQAVSLYYVLPSVLVAFALLGYFNVLNRTAWGNAFGNMGSTLGAGFWIGLSSMIVISVCGIAWSLHTTDPHAELDH